MAENNKLSKLISTLKDEGKSRVVTKEKPLVPGAQRRPRFDPPQVKELSVALQESTVVANDTDTIQQQEKIEKPDEHQRYIHFGNPVFFGFMATVGVGLALLCYFILMNVGALAGWITGALFISLGLDPAVRKLEQWGLPRLAGIITVVAVIAAALTGIILWVVPQIANQAVAFINGFPQQFERFLNSDLVVSLDQQFQIRQWADNEVTDVFNKLTQDSNVVSTFMNSLVNAGSTLANIVTGTIIVLFLSLYFLSSMPLLKDWFVRLTPASKRETVAHLTEEITASVGQYVMGQGIVALLNGTVALILMLIFGVPFPQMLTLFVVILAFIPLVGGVTAGILVSLVALIDSWQTMLAYAIGYFIYLQIEAYFVSPRIMSRAVAVPGGIAVIAVAAGGALWGVLGALIAIPVAASLLILVKEVLVPRQDAN